MVMCKQHPQGCDKVVDKLQEKIVALNIGGFNGVTIGLLEEWVEEFRSNHLSERDKVLDDCCKIDLTYYVWGEKQSDDVGLCRGKDCNYCGRYNTELRQIKQADHP